MSEIVNKVQQSKLETIDLEKLAGGIEVRELDLKDFLFKELILKEKEFRDNLKEYDWSQYDGTVLAVHCSTDAIIPKWAYMLVVQHADEHTNEVFYGTKEEALNDLLREKLNEVDWSEYDDRFVLLKGCSKMDVHPEIYMHATKKLLPRVRKLMYGEACSNVPVYKQPRK